MAPSRNSTITYAVNRTQYVAVLRVKGVTTGGPINQSGIKPVRGYNALYVFTLP